MRNRIWECAIVREEAICLQQSRDYKAGQPIETGSQPALTQTCRQIRGETLEMFYKCNTFRLYIYLLTRFRACGLLRALENHVHELRHVELQVCKHENRYRLDLEGPDGRLRLGRDLQQKSSSRRNCLVEDSSLLKSAEEYLLKQTKGPEKYFLSRSMILGLVDFLFY